MVKCGNLQILPNYSITEMASLVMDRDGYRGGTSAFGLTLLTKILFGKNLSNENFAVFIPVIVQGICHTNCSTEMSHCQKQAS